MWLHLCVLELRPRWEWVWLVLSHEQSVSYFNTSCYTPHAKNSCCTEVTIIFSTIPTSNQQNFQQSAYITIREICYFQKICYFREIAFFREIVYFWEIVSFRNSKIGYFSKIGYLSKIGCLSKIGYFQVLQQSVLFLCRQGCYFQKIVYFREIAYFWVSKVDCLSKIDYFLKRGHFSKKSLFSKTAYFSNCYLSWLFEI